jgi:hypothetical protein
MRVVLATEAGAASWPNEDFAAAAPGAAVLLDGCTTVPRDRDTGCVHGVAWYARTLGGLLLGEITAEPEIPLAAALAAAIGTVRARHEGRCDLSNPATPAATVIAIRAGRAGLDVLALSDSVVVADYGAGRDPVVITDTHRPAASAPEAAAQARAERLPAAGLRAITLLSDGATRIVDQYHLINWRGLLTVLADGGPAELIGRVRAAEASDPDGTRWPRSKASDDATIVYWHQPTSSQA